jgi:hypothetical protein
MVISSRSGLFGSLPGIPSESGKAPEQYDILFQVPCREVGLVFTENKK